MLRRTLIVGSLLMAGGSVFAQNLLVNPGFDDVDQLTGWACDSTMGQPVWHPHDILGLQGSGSMEHNVFGIMDSMNVNCRQCVPVSELWTYVMSGWYFWPDDPALTQVGSSIWSIKFFSDTLCNSYLGVQTTKWVQNPALDTWRQLVTDEVMAPAGSMSAEVYVYTFQEAAFQPVRARIDDLDFSVAALFQDGFESGDLSEWSAATP